MDRPVSLNRLAARSVGLWYGETGEASTAVEMLDQLGLINPKTPRDRRGRRPLIEDSGRVLYNDDDPGRTQGTAKGPARNISTGRLHGVPLDSEQRKNFTTPPGLMSYIEGTATDGDKALEGKVRRFPNVSPGKVGVPPLDKSKCGSIKGRTMHQRRSEPLCTECRVAYNEYQRTCRAKRLAGRPADVQSVAS